MLTLTREQIEWRKHQAEKDLAAAERFAYGDTPDAELWGTTQVTRYKADIALCDMALAWLEVQPVKIKDLPIDCDSAIGFRGDGLHIIFRYGMDRWSTSAISRPWDDEDCAIPLSAILALKTPDKVT